MARSYAANPLLARLQADLDRLFEEALALGRGELGAGAGYPRIDVIEKDDAILVMAELPGLRAGEVTVEIEEDRLTLRGVREAPRAADGATYRRMERGRGPFERTVRLPAPVNGRRAEACLREGVLEVRLPRIEDQRGPHQIPVLESEGGEER